MRRTGVLAVCLAAACGGEDAPPTTSDAEIIVRAAVPADAVPAATGTLSIGEPIEAIGTSAAGTVITAAAGRIHEVRAGAAELRALYADPGDPTEMGEVHHIGPRNGAGAWIGTTAGLFRLDTHYVVHSGLDIGAVLDAGDVDTGGLAGLWMATGDGLIRKSGDQLDRYMIPNLEGAPAEIAVDSAGACGLVRAGGELALLELDAGRIVSDRPPLEAGAIHDVAAGRGVLFAASERGVLRYDPLAKPRWTRFTLTTSADAAEPVHAVAVDPLTGVGWARTDSHLVEIDGDTLQRYPLAAPGAVATIAVDHLGDVWTANGDTLERVSTGAEGAEATFTADVAPWIATHCAACHSNQTANFQDYAVLREKAEAALARVRSGDMPRCAGGVPCAEQRLSPGEYAVLEQWIRAGKPE